MCKSSTKEYSKEQYLTSNQHAKTIMVIDQKYQIKNICLYSGKSTKIYVCWDNVNKQVYVVKEITWKTMVSTFSVINVISIMNSLKGDNFISLVNYTQAQGRLYLFMEYCNQGSLEDLCQKEGFLQFEEAMPIFQKLTKACKQMHKLHIMHRGIKPQNILLNSGIPKISNFKDAVDLLSKDRIFNINPVQGEYDEYSSPEIHNKKQPTLKCDVWSLGVTFYKVLCGQHPWKSIIKISWQEKFKIPIEFPKDIYIPFFFKKILKSMLDPNPETRPCMNLVFDYLNY